MIGYSMPSRKELRPCHPGRLLKMELQARRRSASRLAVELGVPSGRITGILNGRRSITADTAVRLARYFGNGARFWLDLQSHYDIARIERERGKEIAAQVRPAKPQRKSRASRTIFSEWASENDRRVYRSL